VGKVESTAADNGADEVGDPAVRLDCVLFLPSSFPPGSLSRVSVSMSAGSNLRNSFNFSGESCSCACSCANAPTVESNSVKTTARMVFCLLKCVKSFHLSHLQGDHRDQHSKCD
jgi:hypothetical protein